MSSCAQVYNRSAVLRQRAEVLASQLAELQKLRERLRMAEQRRLSTRRSVGTGQRGTQYSASLSDRAIAENPAPAR
jgi:hypothetical protein